MNAFMFSSENPFETQDCADDVPATVLLVEDEEPLRNAIGITLQGKGFNVLSAPAPEPAIQMASNLGHAVDVLVTDLSLPVMDGYTLAAKLVRNGLVRNVVYMSGYSEEPQQLPTINGKRPGYIEKPFRLSKLVAAVNHALSFQNEMELP